MHFFKENVSLKPYNTFGIDAKARLFYEAHSLEELQWVVDTEVFSNNQVLWLGGGSNMLLTKDFDGLVVKISLTGKRHEVWDEDRVLVTAQAGENWHAFVSYTLEQNWGGLENLSLIPGNVGTAPVQNIGAYGVELKDSFYQLKALHLKTGSVEVFDKARCAFGYRDSFFKQKGKGAYIVTEVSFVLSRQNHQVHTEYGAIQSALLKMPGQVSIQKVAKAVISIRQSKLPDPAEIGNSGSFFKNPVVSEEKANDLKQQYPNLVAFPLANAQTKLAAGWLIEQCGFKGYRKGDAGVHAKQALVLVNYGNARGEEIAALAGEIKRAVFAKFAVVLEPEVNMI